MLGGSMQVGSLTELLPDSQLGCHLPSLTQRGSWPHTLHSCRMRSKLELLVLGRNRGSKVSRLPPFLELILGYHLEGAYLLAADRVGLDLRHL